MLRQQQQPHQAEDAESQFANHFQQRRFAFRCTQRRQRIRIPLASCCHLQALVRSRIANTSVITPAAMKSPDQRSPIVLAMADLQILAARQMRGADDENGSGTRIQNSAVFSTNV